MSFPIFDSEDAVPEGFRESYEERDGKWVAKVEDVTGLKTALQKEREARSEAAKERKELEKKLQAIETERRAHASGITSEKLAEIEKAVLERLKPDLEERDRLKAENRSLKLDSQIKTVAHDAEVIDVDDFWKLHGDDFDLTDDGKPIWKSDPTLPIEKAVSSYREKKPHLFRGTQAEGGGAGGSTGKPVTGKQGKVSQLRGADLEAYIEKHGPAAHAAALEEEIREKYAAARAA